MIVLDASDHVSKFYYDKRTVANSEVTKLEKSLQSLTESIPEGFDPKSVSEEQIVKTRDAIQTDKLTKEKHKAHLQRIESLQTQEKEVIEEIERLKTKFAGIQKEVADGFMVKFDYSDDMVLASAEEALAKLEGQREIGFRCMLADSTRDDLNVAIRDAKILDDVVKKLTKEVPEDLIHKAKLPVEGLTIDGDDIKINGVSLDNLSASEQLKFGLQIVRALNGEFKVINIDGIETLDKESFEFFLKEIEEDDFQYFVSRVDGEILLKNGHNIFEIEDGEIKVKKN